MGCIHNGELTQDTDWAIVPAQAKRSGNCELHRRMAFLCHFKMVSLSVSERKQSHSMVIR